MLGTSVGPAGPQAAAGLGLSVAAIAVYFAGQLALQLVGGLLLVATGLVDPAVLGMAGGGPAGGAGSTTLLALVVASQLAGAAGVLVLLRRRGVVLRQVVGPVRPIRRSIAIGAGLGVLALVGSRIVVGVLMALSGSEAAPEQVLTSDLVDTPGRIALAVLAAVVLAPVVEEVLFRGLLHRSLRRRLPVASATVISSVLFAVVHVEIAMSQPLALVGLALVGVVLALAYERTGSLVVPVVIHAVHNAITVVAVVVVSRLEPDAGVGSLVAAVSGVLG